MLLKELLAYASVNPLTQQVGVTEVGGVLVDHFEPHLAQRDRPLPLANATAILAGDVETGCLGHELLCEVGLCSLCIPGLRDHLGVGNSAVEITVTVGV